MNYLSLLSFLLFFTAYFGLMYFLVLKRQNENKNISDYLLSQLDNKIIYSRKNIKADVYGSGKKNQNLYFSYCDLYVIPDAIFLITYSKFINKPMQSMPLMITNNSDLYNAFNTNGIVPEIKKINPDSFSNEVYIDYGESTLDSTNITIHLKNLSEQERNYFRF
ncbi:hypothetical protein GR160_05380 [Flavobacterium sp. Sd200]|uniref:hypothetical protein n=1 Tax=Flavobacterium sp. Sd200 TaxID=2692211 RepID=UPI00136A546B|nr:hypothetical protein [Flavobacterium sp. Sd200]MXN90650.1 hypothetical protein [Flavobacterium sp. Sd200]